MKELAQMHGRRGAYFCFDDLVLLDLGCTLPKVVAEVLVLWDEEAANVLESQ